MIRKQTQLGVAPPSQVNRRPSGRYKVQAPDAPVGSVLRVTQKDGSQRLVELTEIRGGNRVFIASNAELVSFTDWDFASRQEVDQYRLDLLASQHADEIEIRGVPAYAQTVKAMPAVERMAVVTELVNRGKTGKISQFMAYVSAEEDDENC